MTEHRPADGIEEETELRTFMATLAHDLRTPLAAVYGEVDLALRRDRTIETYRDILSRIRVGLSELLDLSADVALLGEEQAGQPGLVALDSVLAALARRYPDASLQGAPVNLFVMGDSERLLHALGLVVEHLRKCDPSGEPVTLEDAAAGDSGGLPVVRLVLRTGPAGAPRRGTFRLRAAAHIIGAFGGVLEVLEAPPGTAVEIRLLMAARE